MNKVVHATAELFVNVALTSYKDGADYWRRASRLLYSSWLIPVTYSRGPRSCSICLAHITSRRKKFKRYFEYWQSRWVLCSGLRSSTAPRLGTETIREQVLPTIKRPTLQVARIFFTHQPERQPSSIAASLHRMLPRRPSRSECLPEIFSVCQFPRFLLWITRTW